MTRSRLAVWFPAVRARTGVDVFTVMLAEGLAARGVRTAVSWLPLRAEYAPWTVPKPTPPSWATHTHINSWLHHRLLPRRMPVVATVHHAIHAPDAERWKRASQRLYHRFWVARVERETLASAAAVVAVSQHAAHHLVDGFPPPRVIHNGVDVEHFRPAARPYGRRPFRLLYVGKWVRAKGVDVLAPLMEMLGPEFELHVIGGAPGNAPATRVHGRLPRQGVAEAMHAADVLVFPSRVEGFGMVVAEAMASGLVPIVASGAAAEIVEDGVSGFVCTGNEPEGFASAVRLLASDPIRHQRMAAAARARIETRFTLGRMVDDYLALYGALG